MPDPTYDAALTDALLEISLAGARQAAEVQQRLAGTLSSDQWSEKGASDFVTEVDRESERLILAQVLERFPHHRILAEENTMAEAAAIERDADPEPEAADDSILWIVDPLDGTTNWLHGYPEYAVSIATLDARGLRTGLVLNSATGELFTAVRDGGAKRNDEPIHVSEVVEPRLALLGTGFPFKKSELVPGYLQALGAMLEHTSGVRRAGAAALDLCDLACGRLDAFWEHWLMEWDVAAAALIVQEAGGTFTPLPNIGDPLLEAAVSGGSRICAAFAGAGRLEEAVGGGFMAGNGALETEITGLWLDAMSRAP